MAIAVDEAVRGKRMIWGAPTFDQVRIGWEETKRGVGGHAKFLKQEMKAIFPTGGSILYRSLDNPDNARGHTADGVVMDEAAEVKSEAWHEVLRPMLLDTDGWAWFLFTPKGRNWVWREHESAHDEPDSIAWQVPTVGCVITERGLQRERHPLENPNILFDEIERIYRTTPERTFRQEILAEFIEDTGGVFRGVRQAATATEQSRAVDGHEYIMGVDWGKHNDFTVLTVLDTTTNEVVALDRFNQIDYHTQLGRLDALYVRFVPHQIIAEMNSMGDPLIEMLQRRGYPVQPWQTTNASKAEAVDALALAFEKWEIQILPQEHHHGKTMIAELQAFEAERLPSGMLRYGAPEGMHDDCVISLALAWQGVAKRAWWIW